MRNARDSGPGIRDWEPARGARGLRGVHERPEKPASRARRGLVLLEVLVALIVLSLVALGSLRLAHESGGLVSNARQWSQAVTYAEDAMELVKLGSSAVHGPPGDLLPGGFRRQVVRQPVSADVRFERVTVTVFLPGGGRFDLDRLGHVAADGTAEW